MTTRLHYLLFSFTLVIFVLCQEPTEEYENSVEEDPDFDYGPPSAAQDYLDYIESGGHEPDYDEDEAFEDEDQEPNSEEEVPIPIPDPGIPDDDDSQPGSLLSNFIGKFNTVEPVQTG